MTFSKWFLGLGSVAIFLLALVISLGDFGAALLSALVSTVPDLLVYFLHLREAKKFYFRIWTDGLEFGSPGVKAFIPFSQIIWIGRTPKPFASRDEVGFAVNRLEIMYSRAVVISPRAKTWTVPYRSNEEIIGLIVYLSDSFVDLLQQELPKRSEVRVKC